MFCQPKPEQKVSAWIHGLAQMVGKKEIVATIPEGFEKKNDILGSLVRTHSQDAKKAYMTVCRETTSHTCTNLTLSLHNNMHVHTHTHKNQLVEHQASLNPLGLREDLSAEDKQDE